MRPSVQDYRIPGQDLTFRIRYRSSPRAVIWNLSVTDNGDGTLQYTNDVTSHPTTQFLAFDEQNGITFRGGRGSPPGRLRRP